jgi:predicted transcriptional regulator
MTDLSNISRRERQILEILYAQGSATVLEIQAQLPESPSDMAIRRMLSILEQKGHVRCRKRGRKNVYTPSVPKQRAAKNALKNVLHTFFGGDVEQALAMHLADKQTEISEEQFDRLLRLIQQAREARE